jgi:hypothetical protein
MKKVTVMKRITAENTILGIGAIINLQHAAPPIIKLLRERYQEDNSCLEGDIDALFKINGSGRGNKDHLYQ